MTIFSTTQFRVPGGYLYWDLGSSESPMKSILVQVILKGEAL